MSRVDSIVAAVVAQIAAGTLKAGERVASVRAGAQQHGVSKNTMAEAYDRLVALGHLEAKPGSGYYVAAARPFPATQPSAHVVEAIDTVSLLREQLVQHYAVRVGDGRAPTSWMAQFDPVRHGGRGKAVRDAELDPGYGNPWGYRALRERIALSLVERGINASPDQVLLTHGANHALDLVSRQLLQPGDTVLVDNPGYYPLFGKLRLSNIRIVGVRRGQDGPDLDDLAAKAAACRPKVFFTQSQGHNPTGGAMSLPVCHRLLTLAAEMGFYLVEDDPFADIMPSNAARLATLDQLDRVIYIGTFSKTLSASLRVGYVAARQTLMNTLCDLKMLTVVSTSDFAERVVYNLIASGQYLRHLRRLKAHVEEAARDAYAALESLGLRMPFAASGGYYMWVELEPDEDEIQLAARAAQQGLFLAPGSIFRPDRTPGPAALRVNIAYANDPRFLAFMRERRSARP